MPRNYCSGITLIELLITILLSSLLVFSMMELLAHAHVSYQKQTQKLAQLQTERYLEYRFNTAIHNAGFLGCGTFNTDALTNQMANDEVTMPLGIYAYSITPNNPRLPEALVKQALPGTQALVVQSMIAPIANVKYAMLENNSSLLINNTNAFSKNDPVVVADCGHADLFNISYIGARNASLAHTVGKNRSGSFSQRYAPPAEVGKLETMLFYIRKPNSKTEQNSGLFIAKNNYSNEIASDVTNLTLRFRLAQQTAFVPLSTLSNGSTISNWQKVTAVEIVLTYHDGHTQTIFTSLRNA